MELTCTRIGKSIAFLAVMHSVVAFLASLISFTLSSFSISFSWRSRGCAIACGIPCPEMFDKIQFNKLEQVYPRAWCETKCLSIKIQSIHRDIVIYQVPNDNVLIVKTMSRGYTNLGLKRATWKVRKAFVRYVQEALSVLLKRGLISEPADVKILVYTRVRSPSTNLYKGARSLISLRIAASTRDRKVHEINWQQRRNSVYRDEV